MTKSKKKSDLQTNYQAMIESVEEFMVKEGKTLQEAFHAAEEKLIDAKEMSKEKIQRMSTDLKNKLSMLAEAAENVGEAYKERIKFDVAYVNSSIWDKLQSIAKTNTNELMEFTRTLREKAQESVTEEHLAAHQEHNEWNSEHAMWLDEVAFWKNEQKQALNKLVDIEKSLKKQTTLINKHAFTIKSNIEVINKHETAMKNAQQDPTSEVFKITDEEEIATHQKERQVHAEQSDAHYKLKTQHFKTMAMISLLYKEIQKVEIQKAE